GQLILPAVVGIVNGTVPLNTRKPGSIIFDVTVFDVFPAILFELASGLIRGAAGVGGCDGESGGVIKLRMEVFPDDVAIVFSGRYGTQTVFAIPKDERISIVWDIQIGQVAALG